MSQVHRCRTIFVALKQANLSFFLFMRVLQNYRAVFFTPGDAPIFWWLILVSPSLLPLSSFHRLDSTVRMLHARGSRDGDPNIFAKLSWFCCQTSTCSWLGFDESLIHDGMDRGRLTGKRLLALHAPTNAIIQRFYPRLVTSEGCLKGFPLCHESSIFVTHE